VPRTRMQRRPNASVFVDRGTHLARLARRFSRKFRLDLSGLRVLTEAATGPFSVTAPLAALAGGTVFAVARPNRYGSAEKSARQVRAVARRLGVSHRIQIVRNSFQAPLHTIDLVTNSGNVRPIDRSFLSQLHPKAVVSLMVEPWELRRQDVNVRAARRFGIALAGPNERGSKVDVFRYLIPLVQRIARKNKLRFRHRNVLLVSSPEFRPYLIQAVKTLGGTPITRPQKADVVILATGPNIKTSRTFLSKCSNGTPVIQLWGDVDAGRLRHLRWLPKEPPVKGHMGYLLSDLGPEPAVRLIAGGLKVGEILARTRGKGYSVRKSVARAVRSSFALPAGR